MIVDDFGCAWWIVDGLLPLTESLVNIERSNIVAESQHVTFLLPSWMCGWLASSEILRDTH